MEKAHCLIHSADSDRIGELGLNLSGQWSEYRDRIVAISSIDTHKFMRRLEQAGMSPDLAEVQAEVLSEAFTVNMEDLVNKEFLESRLDARFAAQKFYIDTRIAELNARVDANFRIENWILGVIVVAVILPYLGRMLAL